MDKAKQVIDAARRVINSPAYQGVCDEDVLLERAVIAYDASNEAELYTRTKNLLAKIAALTPATRDYSPGIGDGMLNQLIDEAKRLISPAP